jgi:hypothetical protein
MIPAAVSSTERRVSRKRIRVGIGSVLGKIFCKRRIDLGKPRINCGQSVSLFQFGGWQALVSAL